MGEIELWEFSCEKCGKSFPIVADAHISEFDEIKDLTEVKRCPYCGSRKIKLEKDYPLYFG